MAIAIIGFIPWLATQSDSGLEFLPLGGIITLVVMIAFAAVLAHRFFQKHSRGMSQGIKVGVTWVLVGVILDVAIVVPLFVKDYGNYFSDYLFWLGYALVLVTIVLVASRKGQYNIGHM